MPVSTQYAKGGRRARVRELGFKIGSFPVGKHNAITDVPGVLVGHTTIIHDQPEVARTGVTVILPRNGRVHDDFPFAGFFSFNGIGEMTGLHLVDEWGVLTSPIVLTNTSQVGTASNALVRYGARKYGGFAYKLPVVAETYDGFLNDIDSFALQEEDVIAALESASSGPVAEGNCGGGTGMICYEFKGGIGTSSRLVDTGGSTYTLGALVQANHGIRSMLRMDGIPMGLHLDQNQVPLPGPVEQKIINSSSIIIVLATNAPLLPEQCKRLSKRAAIGLARTGGVGFNTSGDLFLTISTGNHYPPGGSRIQLEMLHQALMDPLIEAAAEVVEEAILNALTMAETMTGYKGHIVHALPLDRVTDFLTRRE